LCLWRIRLLDIIRWCQYSKISVILLLILSFTRFEAMLRLLLVQTLIIGLISFYLSLRFIAVVHSISLIILWRLNGFNIVSVILIKYNLSWLYVWVLLINWLILAKFTIYVIINLFDGLISILRCLFYCFDRVFSILQTPLTFLRWLLIGSLLLVCWHLTDFYQITFKTLL